jgi:predicted NUDIX family NTP pyrophosphohydrolase
VGTGTESAGILLYRRVGGELEVLIAHPGGPFWKRRDAGAWTIPKGLVEAGENPRDAARREFTEETGHDPGDALVSLGEITQKAGKTIHVWAAAGDFDPDTLESNPVEIEYPRGSGRIIQFAEIDRVMWAQPPVAQEKLNQAQAVLIQRLIEKLQSGS